MSSTIGEFVSATPADLDAEADAIAAAISEAKDQGANLTVPVLPTIGEERKIEEATPADPPASPPAASKPPRARGRKSAPPLNTSIQNHEHSPADSEDDAEAAKQADAVSMEDPVPEEPVQLAPVDWAAAIPREGRGMIIPGTPVEGIRFPEWDGNPETEIMPGTLVLYWTRPAFGSPGQPAMAVPVLAMVTQRVAEGLYVGVRFKPVQGGVFQMRETRVSAVPKLDCITARKVFPPEACLIT